MVDCAGEDFESTLTIACCSVSSEEGMLWADASAGSSRAEMWEKRIVDVKGLCGIS